MDNSSTGLTERASGGTSLSNGPSFRRASRPVTVDSGGGGGASPHFSTFIVHKDENGYGMKVSGDNPVYVQSVKAGGAAEKAGLQREDKIIKVNGVNVTQSTHTDVVALIKSATQVVLTVQQRPPQSPLPRPVSATMTSPSLHSRPLMHHNSAPARDRITSPQPVDVEKMRQLECERVRTLQLMLEKEQRYVEALRSEIAKSNDPKMTYALSGAERRVRTLQDQLLSLTTTQVDNEYSPPPSRPSVIYEHESDTPPPLPSRNRPITTPTEIPPPLPPRPFPLQSSAQGGDNAHGAPVNQCLENTNNAHLSPTNNYAVNPQVSSLHTHHRTKSSPDPLNMQNMSLAEASKRLIASESMSDLSVGSKRSRGGISWDVDSPRITPPGTPPPPYGGNAASEGGEPGTNTDGHAHNEQNASDEASPQRSPQNIIISMEDDDMSDQEMSQLEDHGPFKSLSKLWEHNAHLAVFMNYVISNSDPSSLLFYLLTDLYKEGNAKEMRKWAYEIHSSFLVPGAPLRLNNVDENVAREIDDVLLKDSDREEILRKIFWKARLKAKEELNEQLADFQQKRTAGLGTIFGPADAQLDESIHDKNKELKIIETILMPKIEPYLEDIERDFVDIRRFTTGAALGTVMSKVFGLRGPHSNALLDRCPTFVSKDKSLKARFIGKSRKMTIRGHHFVAHQYFTVTYCNHCQLIIWGVGPQGYQCSNCLMNIHRHCVRVVEESCPGPLNKKEKGNDRISKLMDKIRPAPSERDARRKPSSLNLPHLDRTKKHPEDGDGLNDADGGKTIKIPELVKQMWFNVLESSFLMSSFKSKIRRRKYALARSIGGSSRSAGSNVHNQNSKVVVDGWEYLNFNPVACGRSAEEGDDASLMPPPLPPRGPSPVEPPPRPPPWLATLPHAVTMTLNQASETGDRPVSGGRGAGDRRVDPVRESEERSSQDGLHNENDDHHHEITHHIPKKPSTTSIGRSESYKERVQQKRQLRERRKTSDPNLSKTNDVDLDNSQGLSYNTNSGSSSNSSLSTRSLDSPSISLEIVNNARTQEAQTITLTPNSSGTLWDSDLESEPDPPDWSRGVEDEVLKSLTAREKKRQDVINELFHTERSHVRNLKVLEQVFYRPMVERELLPHDQIQLLFANLDEMLDIHSQFNNGMKTKRRETPLVGDLAHLLLEMFDGPAGENFQRAAATFCARQQIALEALKERRRKDAKLHNFLTDAEVNPMCRRLQLKDIIPTALQRLTKYPLLFESLCKYTAEDAELLNIQRAVERSKEILNHVNHAVREAEDNHRLADIQKRLDKAAFDKMDHPMASEFKSLDLTKHRLIYEGSLSWRIGNRTKLVDLHVLLLDDVILLLQKQDEKYLMKFYNLNVTGGGGSPPLSPIIKVSTVLVRPNAVDKKALYLVNTSQNGAQIYDLVATSSSERKIWFRHISEAAEAYKTRDGKNRRSEPSVSSQPLPTPDPETPELPTQDKTKESDENSSDPAALAKEPGSSSDTLATPGGSTSSNALDSSLTSTGTSDLATPQTTPGESSNSQPETPDALLKKLGDGLLSPSPGSQRRRMEPLRLTTEESPLIQPSEVVVSQRSVLTADKVLTPIERLKRKDEAIRIALSEKQQLVADILHVPREEFETIAELAGEPTVDKEATELVLAAVNQANQLASALNDALLLTVEAAVSATSEVSTSPRACRKVDRIPGVPACKIQSISDSLNMQLTQLLSIMKHRDEEREQLRRELQKHREQVHAMLENRHKNHLAVSQPSPASSRPNSCVSGASEEDTGLQRLSLRSDHVDDELVVAPPLEPSTDPHEEVTSDEFVDALTGREAETHQTTETDQEANVAGV